MIRIKSLFAVLVLAATVAVVPAANAQVVHYVGAGSSAMFQGFGVAAVNDLGSALIAAQAAGGHPGFTVHHWSVKTSTGSGTLAGLKDSRTPVGGAPPPVEFGNLWVAWTNDAEGTPTDVWAYLSVDSTVGVRTYLAAPRADLLLNVAVETTAGVNAISSTLFNPANADEAGLPASIWTALSGTLGKPITAGMTDIRPEDALLATNRLLGTPGDTSTSGTVGTTDLFYSFALGYGPGPVGNPVLSSQSSTKATPVSFALPGFNDPITNQPVSNTIEVFPVGESPIVFLVNRTNPAGLGQTLASDSSYYARNVWDQHPWPATSVYPSLTEPSAGTCSIVANQLKGECHVTRRPLGNLFSGGDCEGDSSAFTWPLDPNTQGLRATVPNGTPFPLTLIEREPLSGTYNTTEFSEIRRYGTVNGSNGVSAPFEKPPYVSQETNVIIASGGGAAPFNPLNAQCPAKYVGPGDPADTTEGFRIRAIGTGEEVATVKAKQDSLGYAFFSFGNVSSISATPSYGYLMVDAIDPLFADYENAAANPGQPAATGSPLTWGELPACSEVAGSPLPHCTVAAIWGSNPSYPHIRDGSYPAWSELRMMCDTADASCTVSSDPYGAEALVQNLQADIHNGHLGGVPDLLPFSDAASGALSFNPPYGDAGFIRDHYSFLKANDFDIFSNIAPYSSATVSTTHESNTLVQFNLETCGPNPVDGPAPINECGGDAGGFIVPVGTITATKNLQ
jgi:hypothetical protein